MRRLGFVTLMFCVAAILSGWIALLILVALHFGVSANVGGCIAIAIACCIGGMIGVRNPRRKSTRWKAFRNYSLATFGLAAAGSFAVTLAAGIWFVQSFTWDSRSENVDLRGDVAQRQLTHAWPDGIDPKAVTSVSRIAEQSRDSFSVWWRVVTTPDVAKRWSESLHSKAVVTYAEFVGTDGTSVEGVRRTINGRIPLGNYTGNIPKWWSPPSQPCDATEAMLWYAGGDSGVARGTYTKYDTKSGVLWVYEYGCQHDLLWPKGSPLAGQPLFSAEQKQD